MKKKKEHNYFKKLFYVSPIASMLWLISLVLAVIFGGLFYALAGIFVLYAVFRLLDIEAGYTR